MADLSITSSSQALTPVQPAGRSEAVKAAQRAFFNAALTQAQATGPIRPQTSEVVSAPTAARPSFNSADAAPTDRVLRPGSLLDIRV